MKVDKKNKYCNGKIMNGNDGFQILLDFIIH
jgi:hypothetical protein